MKFYRHFRVRELGFPAALYKEIVAMKPECRGKEDFVIESQPGDEVTGGFIESLVDFCRRHSLTQTGTGEIGTYGYDVVRHYDSCDLEVAPLLMLLTQKRMFREILSRDYSGRLMLPARQSGTAIKIASGMFNNLYVVSDSARKVLEAVQLAGIFFRETALSGTSARATAEALWEMDSNIKLPKMMNSVLNEHSVVPCYAIDELPYRYGEPHYRQSDILPLGQVDIARTFEPLGSEPGLIVSQSFYQHCLRSKIPLEVRPVRIDPD
jgi:hypothetical protein